MIINVTFTDSISFLYIFLLIIIHTTLLITITICKVHAVIVKESLVGYLNKPIFCWRIERSVGNIHKKYTSQRDISSCIVLIPLKSSEIKI